MSSDNPTQYEETQQIEKLWAESPGDGGLLHPLDPKVFSAKFLNDFFAPGGEGMRIPNEHFPKENGLTDEEVK